MQQLLDVSCLPILTYGAMLYSQELFQGTEKLGEKPGINGENQSEKVRISGEMGTIFIRMGEKLWHFLLYF